MDTNPSVLSAADTKRLDDLYSKIANEAESYVGFPWNSRFDYDQLLPFLSYPINNDGDPYSPSAYHLNTHEFEREVVETFAQLTQAPANSTWGYITSGGTEGNLYGIFLARELYPEGVFYCSQETFAMKKLLRSLRVPNVVIRSHEDGRMDVAHLREELRANPEAPPTILANIGTTLKGAVDDLDDIKNVLSELSIQKSYIHADAALSGMVLPFVENAPPWNFSAGVDSLSISLHKMVGSPLPCGVVLAKKDNLDRVAAAEEGIGRFDTTILASRNAITPLFIWYAFRTVGMDGFRERTRECFRVADYTIEGLSKIGWPAWRHPYANTVVFDRPSESLTHKWQLFAEGTTAHILTMPHVTRDQIDRLVEDLANDSTEGHNHQIPDDAVGSNVG